MNIKKNWREFSLIVLGLLVIVTPFVAFDTILGWAEAVWGLAIIIVGAWPLISRLPARILDLRSGPQKKQEA